MKFPQSLAPWAQYLQIFPRELSLALGPLVQRIALTIGPLRTRSHADAGEPDGFGGLAKSGTYERLLASEWMLAEEVPDEFVRRAVMGEHLFLKLARSEHSGSRISGALFDAGPNQAGSPRIAHLAALIVLARRAEAAGAQFSWGMLSSQDTPLFSEVTESNVLRLLEARSPREVTNADLALWRERLSNWQELDDLWIVGGARLADLPASQGLSHLFVRDVFDPEARQLSLTVRGASSIGARAVKEITLDLPDDRASVRLLRDPFGVVSATPHRVKTSFAPASNLLFDAKGVKLFAHSPSGSVLCFPIPNSPRAEAGNPKLYHPSRSYRVVAVGRMNRTVALITAHRWPSEGGDEPEQLLALDYCGKRNQPLSAGYYVSRPYKVSFAPFSPGNLLQPCLLMPKETVSRPEALVLDSAGNLFRLFCPENHAPIVRGHFTVGVFQLVAKNVLAIAPVFSCIVYLGKGWTENEWRIVSKGVSDSSRGLPHNISPTQAFFGFGGSLADYEFGLLAIEDRGTDWIVICRGSEHHLAGPLSGRVVGVARVRTSSDQEPGLIVLEDDNRTFTLYSNTTSKQLLKAAAPIASVTTSHAAPIIAYTTTEGEVNVYSLAQGVSLCRYLPWGKA